MRGRRTTIVTIVASGLLLMPYPALVLGYTWSHVGRSDLPGGRNGPLYAYRHTLASAVVAFTLSPRAVEWVTVLMEFGGSEESVMDRHNNQLGSFIGSTVRSFAEIEQTVRAKVLGGTTNGADPAHASWLGPEHWGDGWLW